MRCKPVGFDLRSLGLFRIAFGLVLIGNEWIRTSNGKLEAHYTELGVLPVKLLPLTGPYRWSFLDYFSSPLAAKAAFAIIFLIYVSYTFGFFTKICQFLVVACLLSLLHRNRLVDDGSDCIMRMFAVWTLFLPLGDRFSIDRWRGKPQTAHHSETYESWAVWFLLMNLAACYLLNAFQKNSTSWLNGSALYYVFWDHWIATPLAGYVRNHVSLTQIKVLTYGALATEYSLGLLILLIPFSVWTRRGSTLLMLGLHASIATFMYIGSFSFVFIACSVLFISSTDWNRYFPHSKISFEGLAKDLSVIKFRLLTNALACLLALYFLTEGVLGNPRVPSKLQKVVLNLRPGFFEMADRFLLIPQEWFMFRAPGATTSTASVQAELDDGRVIDYLRPELGTFDGFRPVTEPTGIGKYWLSYMIRMTFSNNLPLRQGFADYLFQYGVRQFSVFNVVTVVPHTPGSGPTSEYMELIYSGKRP